MAEIEKVDLGLPENGEEAVTGKKKTSILELIKEKIRGARQYLYDTFVDVDKNHPIFSKMNKTEAALNKLDDIEAISAANLQALYDISCTFESAIKAGNIDGAAKELDTFYELVSRATEQSMQRMRMTVPDFQGLLAEGMKDALGDKYDPNVHYEDNIKVFTAEDGRVFIGLMNKEGTKLEPVLEAEFNKKASDTKETVLFKSMKTYSIELDPEKTSVPLLRNNANKDEAYLKLTKYENFGMFSNTSHSLGRLQFAINNCLAEREGGKAYEQAVYLSKNPAVKLLEPYANNTVKDDNGLEASFLPYDKTFRIYNPDTKELTVFEKNEQGGFTGMLYSDVESIDAKLYMPKETDTIDLNAVEFDKTKPMYKGVPIMEARTVKRNGKDIAETHTSIPLGNTSLYYTLQSEATKAFLLSQGIDEFNVRQIMDIGKNDGIVVDKNKLIKSTAQLAETASVWEGYVKQTLDAEYAADSKEINSLAAKVTRRGGSAISLETPEGGEFRLSLNGKGNAVTLDYKEPNGTAFQSVYDPVRGVPKISAQEFRVLSAKDKTFQSVLAASAYTMKERLTGEITKVEKKEHASEQGKNRKDIERD